jgi:hypothetical protein
LEISKLEKASQKVIDTHQILEKDCARARDENVVLRKRIAVLEEQMASGAQAVKSKELEKAILSVDVKQLKFHGLLAEKQSMQARLAELMVKLAEDIQKSGKCGDCQVKLRSVAFKPCGHFFYCQSCYEKRGDGMRMCPLCAHDVESHVKAVL